MSRIIYYPRYNISNPFNMKVGEDEKSPFRCNITGEQTPPSKRKLAYFDRCIPSSVKRVLDFTSFINEEPIVDEEKKKRFSESTGQKETSAEIFSIKESHAESNYKKLLLNELKETKDEEKPDILKSSNVESPESCFKYTYKATFESSPSVFNSSAKNPFCSNNQKILQSVATGDRHVSTHPFKILDAPGLANDYYLNLIDWSKNNIISVGLGNKVYLWDYKLCKILNTIKTSDIQAGISCIKFSRESPNILSFTTGSGYLYIYDVIQERRLIKKQISDSQRVGSSDWNGSILSLGARNGTITHFDTKSSLFVTGTSEKAHSLEVCGLKWDNTGKVLASGGNDNRIFLWCMSNPSPICSLSKHQGAVKALAWSPYEYGLLASGGGSADRCINFWNTRSQQIISSIDTKSQVCNLSWSSCVENELISTHGFSSNAINIWKYPSMDKLITLKGHTSRVIYMSVSPDGEKIITGASDETLRFWSIFDRNVPTNINPLANSLSLCTIR